MTPDLANVRLIFVVLAALGIVGLFAFDAYAWFTHGPDATASGLIHQWSRDWPIIPFIVGALMAHLFWKGTR